MTNRFYQNIIDLITGNKARATEVEANFSLVEAGFDAATLEYDASFALRSLKGGDTYTGVHNFTGATISAGVITVPAQSLTDDSTKAANTAWARAYLAQQIASVNAGAGFLTAQRYNTASVTGLIGVDHECRFAGVMTISAPVATVDRQAFGVTTLNGQNNIVDFGSAVVRGPFGTITGLVTMDFLNPIFRWDATNNEWSSR